MTEKRILAVLKIEKVKTALLMKNDHSLEIIVLKNCRKTFVGHRKKKIIHNFFDKNPVFFTLLDFSIYKKNYFAVLKFLLCSTNIFLNPSKQSLQAYGRSILWKLWD